MHQLAAWAIIKVSFSISKVINMYKPAEGLESISQLAHTEALCVVPGASKPSVSGAKIWPSVNATTVARHVVICYALRLDFTWQKMAIHKEVFV